MACPCLPQTLDYLAISLHMCVKPCQLPAYKRTCDPTLSPSHIFIFSLLVSIDVTYSRAGCWIRYTACSCQGLPAHFKILFLFFTTVSICFLLCSACLINTLIIISEPTRVPEAITLPHCHVARLSQWYQCSVKTLTCWCLSRTAVFLAFSLFMCVKSCQLPAYKRICDSTLASSLPSTYYLYW